MITQLLFDKKLRYTKKGITIGAIAGMLWGLGGVVMAIAFGYEPFASYADVSLYIVPLVGACLGDLFAGLVTLCINCKKGKRKEYFRILKTKPGLIICLGAIFGGPIAMSG